MSPAGNQMPEPQGQRPPAILLVEDDVLLRLSVCDHLRDAGFTVHEAASGDEAKAVLGAGVEVDLVFSDVQMPGETDGVALAAWTRSNFPNILIVLTSGAAVGLEQSASGKTEGVVPKPYDHEALIGRLQALLAARAQPA
jgi:CheY-like chemotaxis protein